MKTARMTALVSASFALRAQAYLPVEQGSLNVRHYHVVERRLDGEIVGRAFSTTFDVHTPSVSSSEGSSTRLEARGRSARCQTISACGTPGGCALMAAQTYCKGEDPKVGFQRAVKQTGANGKMALKLIGESVGRGPAGMVVGAVKATAKALVESKKEREKGKAKLGKGKGKGKPKKKASPKKVKAKAKKAQKKPKSKPKKHAPKKASRHRKRDLEEGILNRRDFEFVVRDEDMTFVERGEYSVFDLVVRDVTSGEFVSRECEMFNESAVSCM